MVITNLVFEINVQPIILLLVHYVFINTEVLESYEQVRKEILVIDLPISQVDSILVIVQHCNFHD